MTQPDLSWFVRNKGRIVGPFNRAQVESLRRRGQISRVTEISEDRVHWSKAATLDWLFEAEAGPTAPPSSDEPDYVVTEPAGTLPAPGPTKAEPSDGVSWYYNKGDAPCGPVPLAELRQLAETGQIAPQSLVWNSSMPGWAPSSQVLDLPFPPSSGGKPQARGKSSDDPMSDPGLDLGGPGADEDGYGILEPFVGLFTHATLVISHIFTAQMLKRRVVRWSIGIGLFPLALLLAVGRFNLDFNITAWLIALYFALFITAFFYGVMRPTSQDWNRGLFWGLITILIGIPLLLAAQADTPFRYLYQKLESENLLEQFLGYFLGVGLLEELAKVLPFFLFSVRKGERLELRTGLFLGMICGFGFAIAESVNFYMGNIALSGFQNGMAVVELMSSQGKPVDPEAVKAALQGAFVVALLTQIVRFICTPLLHASWSAINGWFIASASQRSSGRIATITIGLLFTALLHGTYDTFIGSDSIQWQAVGMAAATVSILAFMAHLSMALDSEKATP